MNTSSVGPWTATQCPWIGLRTRMYTKYSAGPRMIGSADVPHRPVRRPAARPSARQRRRALR